MTAKKNQGEIIIRRANLEDAQSVLNIQFEVILEEQYLISASEEFHNSVEQQRGWLQKILDNDREIMLVAELNNEVVGWIVFQSPNRKRLAHTGSFGMMIQKEYRGFGIGKKLINELLNWAEKNPLIEKVSLGVFSTNHRAIGLYKSMGFIEEGRKINEIKINDAEYADDILMYKMV